MYWLIIPLSTTAFSFEINLKQTYIFLDSPGLQLNQAPEHDQQAPPEIMIFR